MEISSTQPEPLTPYIHSTSWYWASTTDILQRADKYSFASSLGVWLKEDHASADAPSHRELKCIMTTCIVSTQTGLNTYSAKVWVHMQITTLCIQCSCSANGNGFSDVRYTLLSCAASRSSVMWCYTILLGWQGRNTLVRTLAHPSPHQVWISVLSSSRSIGPWEPLLTLPKSAA